MALRLECMLTVTPLARGVSFIQGNQGGIGEDNDSEALRNGTKTQEREAEDGEGTVLKRTRARRRKSLASAGCGGSPPVARRGSIDGGPPPLLAPASVSSRVGAGRPRDMKRFLAPAKNN